MNKMARFFRIVGGLLLLADIGLLFLPVIKAVQENYPTVTYRQTDFIKDCFNKIVRNNSDLRISGGQTAEIIIFILLPVLLALVFGIVSIVAGQRQIVSGFGAILTAVLNIIFTTKAIKLGEIYKKQFQVIEKQQGLTVILIASIILIVFGIMIIVTKPAKVKKSNSVENVIPDVEQIHQEQIKPKYEFIDEAKQDNNNAPATDDGRQQPDITMDSMTQTEKDSPVQTTNKAPRGVMVGISGMYAGAEIPFRDGEEIKFGRDKVNDVVFPEALKVSRSHCVITWDAKKQEYYIVDNSSNGCFINEMDECIPQNLPIRMEVGTILDIGDKNNRFRLE